jgi:peptidoglycan/LPS O-acetylase OafA/YrhL
MDVVINGLMALTGLAMFVCLIMVVVQLYKQKGIMHAILGFICGLYAFIWGWQNIKKEELKLKNWMYGWTAALGVYILLAILSVVVANILNNVANSLGG